MQLEKLPAYSTDLINILDTEIPVRLPSITDHERLIWFNIGRRSVIDMLIELKRQAEESALIGDNDVRTL